MECYSVGAVSLGIRLKDDKGILITGVYDPKSYTSLIDLITEIEKRNEVIYLVTDFNQRFNITPNDIFGRKFIIESDRIDEISFYQYVLDKWKEYCYPRSFIKEVEDKIDELI